VEQNIFSGLTNLGLELDSRVTVVFVATKFQYFLAIISSFMLQKQSGSIGIILANIATSITLFFS